MTKRTAIVMHKSLSPGEAANCAAILAGQAARISPDLYSEHRVVDAGGAAHAAIRYSMVVLRAKSAGQLASTVMSAADDDDVEAFLFSAIGQRLHNRFDEYVQQLAESGTVESEPVAMVVTGPDEAVRNLTKKFSVYG